MRKWEQIRNGVASDDGITIRDEISHILVAEIPSGTPDIHEKGNLIAAAPELLRVLEELVDVIESEYYAGDEAHAIIAKAKGE